jgi:hypothetical protein
MKSFFRDFCNFTKGSTHIRENVLNYWTDHKTDGAHNRHYARWTVHTAHRSKVSNYIDVKSNS